MHIFLCLLQIVFFISFFYRYFVRIESRFFYNRSKYHFFDKNRDDSEIHWQKIFKIVSLIWKSLVLLIEFHKTQQIVSDNHC